MGLGGISPGSLVLIALIASMVFGTKRLRSLGEDLGEAVRGFKRGLNGESTQDKDPQDSQPS